MSHDRTIRLKDGRTMAVKVYTYPIVPAEQIRLIELHQHEWPRTDVDWLQSMRGAYRDTLRTHAAMGLIEDTPVGTASVAYPVQEPQVCVVEDVMTRREYRGLGIGANLTELVVQRAFDAGCRVAYLGNAPVPHSVYEKVGFERVSGAFMRRSAPGHDKPETIFYEPGQRTQIRDTPWGDLPSFACLMAQPLDCVLVDYRRGLVSPKHTSPVRCVSNFSTTWYDVQANGGAMLSLLGEAAHRVLGFGTLTPGPPPIRNHTATIDVAVHPHYADQGPALVNRLLSKTKDLGVELVEAYVSATDTAKAEWFTGAGLEPIATLPEALRLNDQGIDLLLLQSRAGSAPCAAGV